MTFRIIARKQNKIVKLKIIITNISDLWAVYDHPFNF
jgi:hypothetical protein